MCLLRPCLLASSRSFINPPPHQIFCPIATASFPLLRCRIDDENQPGSFVSRQGSRSCNLFPHPSSFPYLLAHQSSSRLCRSAVLHRRATSKPQSSTETTWVRSLSPSLSVESIPDLFHGLPESFPLPIAHRSHPICVARRSPPSVHHRRRCSIEPPHPRRRGAAQEHRSATPKVAGLFPSFPALHSASNLSPELLPVQFPPPSRRRPPSSHQKNPATPPSGSPLLPEAVGPIPARAVSFSAP